jgi:Cys-rich four helix bundle protein (predicted Tat secretion target)
MPKTESSRLDQNEQKPAEISRRDLLIGMGAAAATAYAGSADKGERCIAHCLVSFQEGDLELADCAAKVHEMQAICGAYSYLLAANSGYSKAYASVCKQVCEDCEKECRKHEKHIECRACADACAEVVEQIELNYG